MKARGWLIGGCVGGLMLGLAGGAEPAPRRVRLDPEQAVREGQALVHQLRSQQPSDFSVFKGQLRVRSADGKWRSLPLLSRVIPGEKSWEVIYEIAAAATNQAEQLSVTHQLEGPNQYRWTRGSETMAEPPLTTPLALSDFSLGDLGLEFLQWPEQRVLYREMRRGRPCQVLESVAPADAPARSLGYRRVRSWVDIESGGLLRAEALDAQDKVVKEFAVGSFKKVNGQWQLHDLEMRNEKQDTRTKIVFELQ
jgi:hypothetical protein